MLDFVSIRNILFVAGRSANCYGIASTSIGSDAIVKTRTIK